MVAFYMVPYRQCSEQQQWRRNHFSSPSPPGASGVWTVCQWRLWCMPKPNLRTVNRFVRSVYVTSEFYSILCYTQCLIAMLVHFSSCVNRGFVLTNLIIVSSFTTCFKFIVSSPESMKILIKKLDSWNEWYGYICIYSANSICTMSYY